MKTITIKIRKNRIIKKRSTTMAMSKPWQSHNKALQSQYSNEIGIKKNKIHYSSKIALFQYLVEFWGFKSETLDD